MTPRVCLLLAFVSTGCTAIRPLDPLDAVSGHDGGAGDAALGIDAGMDAASDLDAAMLDAFAVDAATDADLDAHSAGDALCGPEICGGGDEDCDGLIDEADAIGTTTYYLDFDHDNYGADTGSVTACRAPSSGGPWISRGGDCDDMNRQINPSRAEVCNGLDDDCNGLIDDGLSGCTITCTSATYGGHNYMFCGDTRTQTDAASRCSAMGYHLVDIGDMAENDFVQSEAMMLGLGGGSPAQGIWIGLTESTTMPPTYTWTDGTVPTYLHWDTAALEPNGTGTCVRMRTYSGYWADQLCTNLYPYVCEEP